MLPAFISLIRRGALLAPLLLAPGLAAQDLFWTERVSVEDVLVPVIMGADIDGENVTEVFRGTDMASFIVDLEVTDSHLYWSGHSGGDVWRQTLGTSDAARIVDSAAGLSSVHGIAVDATAGKIYIADHGSHQVDDPGGIYSTNIDGTSGIQGLWTTGSPWFYTGISLGGANQLLWITRSSDWLYNQSTSGGMPGAVQLESHGEIYGVTYVPSTGLAYYTNYGANTLHWVNPASGDQGTLWTPDMVNPLGLKLSPAGTHLIIAERGRGISAYELSTGGYELLVSAPNAHFGVVATANPGTLELPPPPPPPTEDGDALFFANFENDTAGQGPSTQWTSAGSPPENGGSSVVLNDAENVFGQGQENKFLRVENAHWFDLLVNYEPADIVTLSFDYIGRIHPEDGSRAVNFNLRTGASNNDRVHVLQINPMSGLVDTIAFGMNDLPYRFDLTVNNSVNDITYDKPDGSGSETLKAGFADLWRYDYAGETWTRLRNDYQNVRHSTVSTGNKMMNFSIQLDSHERRRSFDLDNVFLFKGAVPGNLPREADVSYPPIPYPEVPVLIAHETFDQFEGPFEITDTSQYHSDGPFVMSQIRNSNNGGTVHIVQDTENRFGRGPDNLVLYLNHVLGTRFDLPIGTLNSGVATVSFDMYHEGDYTSTISSQTNRLGARFYVKAFENANIVNNFGLEANLNEGTYFVRGITSASRRVHPHYLQRWTVVRNNTRDTITYDSPRGPMDLSAGSSHVWLNGFLFNEEYGYGDQVTAEEQVITGFRFDAFNSWTAYIDNIRVWEGAIVPEAHVERDVEPAERDLLVYEGFDYAEGSLDGLNGGIGWGAGYTTQDGFPSAEVVSPSLDWPWLQVAGNHLRAAGPTPESDNAAGTRNFRTIDIDGIHSSMLNKYSPTHIGPQGGSIWLSVVGQGNPDQTGTFWGFGLYRDTPEQSGEVLFLGKGSTDVDGWRFVGGGGSSTSGSLRTGKPLLNRHFWVIRIDYHDDGNHAAYLFHNPDPNGPEPTEAVISRETRIGSFGFDRIRIAGNGAGFMLDEIRIGTSWEAVAPLGSEPPVQEGFAGWVASHFLGGYDPAIVGAGADPDGDGVPNLLEYALGTAPDLASRADLPYLGVGTFTVGGVEDEYLTLIATLSDEIFDLDVGVDTASDLGDWALGAGVLVEPAVSNGDGTTTFTFRDAEPLSSGERRFLRLNVSQSAD